jgi:hypothetical protein
MPDEELRRDSMDREIAETKERIAIEEQEIVDLKRELGKLIREQEELQIRSQEDSGIIAATLVQALEHEEEEIQKFYSLVLGHCEGIPKKEFELLASLIYVVQNKRKVVADETEQNQRILRLIRFHKTNRGPDQNTEEFSLPLQEPATFDNPLPCLSQAMAPKRVRKKITFRHEG